MLCMSIDEFKKELLNIKEEPEIFFNKYIKDIDLNYTTTGAGLSLFLLYKSLTEDIDLKDKDKVNQICSHYTLVTLDFLKDVKYEFLNTEINDFDKKVQSFKDDENTVKEMIVLDRDISMINAYFLMDKVSTVFKELLDSKVCLEPKNAEDFLDVERTYIQAMQFLLDELISDWTKKVSVYTLNNHPLIKDAINKFKDILSVRN